MENCFGVENVEESSFDSYSFLIPLECESSYPSIHPNERKYEAVKFHFVSQLQPTKGKSQKSKVKSLADRFETSALLQDNQDKTGQNRCQMPSKCNSIDRSVDRSIGRWHQFCITTKPFAGRFFPDQQPTTNN
jgi:hypothetical protein